MFGPRGASPQRPREANPSCATPPGPFPAGDAADLQRKPAPAAPQGPPRGLSGQESFQSTLSHRIKVLVTLHRPDPRQVKEKPNLHPEQKTEARSARWDGAPRSAGTAGSKPPGPARGAEQSSNAQNRYTPESASSILASFGLSNEDLEELSRYPDDQLTPENMPLILREIRIRKMGHSAAGARSQRRGEETVGGTSGAAVKSKVIDYGHASKYGYTEDPLEVRAYDPEEPTEDPLEASVYNPEALGRENREDFQREQNVPVVVPPPSVPCSPVFPVEDLIKPPVFQNGSSNPGSFFPAVPARKVPPLCPSPVGLPVVKPVAQPALPAMPPVLPPILPPILPPLAQPILPPVMPPLVQQSVTQHIISPLPQPPFSAVLITTVSQHEQIPHERIAHEPGPSQPGAQSGPAPGPKPFQPEPEGPIRSPFGIVKASWLPTFLQRGAHRTKRWPTSTMMNDYYATSPRAFPHVCSLCSIECTHMEDWILHQNSTSHIESCRQLRQQYPDWNPESYSSKRNAGERKENQTPKRRSGSGSRSPSPRRSRGSGSSSARRRSRSRSRSPGRYWPTRPRCWSPRPMRRPSPRHRSRSPQRSRNPLRTSPRPRRSASNDWAARRSSGSQDRKPSLETVVKTLRPDFVAEITKHKSLQAGGPGPSGSGKAPRSHPLVGKKPLKARVSAKASKKGGTAIPGSSSSPPEADDLPQSQEEDEEEEEASPGAGGAHPAADNRLLSEELLSFGTVLQISDLPDDGFTDQDIKNIFQPFGKVSDILVLRSRNEAFLEMNYKEAVIAAVKYGESVPVLVNGKRVKISVAEKPKEPPGPAKAAIKKRAQTPKKAAPSTKKHRAPSTKTTKALPAKPPEGAEAAAAGAAGAEAQAAEPESGSGGDRRTEPAATAATQHSGAAEPGPAPEPLAQAPEAAVADVGAVDEAVADQEAPRAAVKSEEPPAPGGKDWILHQNSTSHIESCRQLRQQYPDWNPESYSSKRNAGERKENQTPKRRSGSGSRSPSPRRSRGSGSSCARRRSRSRSRSPGRYWPTRPRCWSPRPMRRPSPRHRSRSPQRSRNPLRTSPRPRRSASNDWAARRSSGSQDRKPSLETVVKTLRPDFVAEITKHKSLQAGGPGPSGSGKAPRSHPLVGKKPLKARVSAKASKKGGTAIPGSSSSPPEADDLPQSQEEDEEEEEASPGAGAAHPAADNRLLSEELLSFGTVLQISDLPDDGFTDQDIKNIFQPFGKVSDILVLRSRNEAFLEMNYKEAVIAAVKYGESVPVLVNGKRVKISVAEKPKEPPGPAKAAIKKRAQTPKKAAPSTKKHRAPSTKTTKALPAKPPEGAEAAAAGVASAEAQAAEPESGSGGDRRTEPAAAAATQHSGAAEPGPAPEPLAQAPEAAVADVGAVDEAVADQEAPRAAVKSEEPPAPGGKDWILHQNSTSHIESCRQLRQQYPDWNPESYSSKRNAGERKENQTPKRRSGSGSRSPSPRRSRGSGSSCARRRSRSRSRSPGRYWPTRPRCWSPRPMRRPSPRHRSRSPQRSRNPLRTSPRPRRSASNDWAARRSSGSQDRKPSLETVVKTLRPDFVAEITKHKSLQAGGPGPSGSGKAPRSHPLVGKKPLKARVSAKASKKGGTAIPGSSSSPPEADDLPQSQEVEEDEDEEEEEASPGAGAAHPAADNRLLSEELLSFGTVLQISDLPDDGFTDQDIKNIFQPFGKVSDILVLRSRNEAFLEMNYKEAVIAAVEYGKTVPVLVNGKRVKISVAEKPKEPPGPAKPVTKKQSQTPKKAAPSTKKHRTPSTKPTKPLPAKPPEGAEAAAAGAAGAEAQAAEPESGSGGDRRTEPAAAAATQHSGAAEPGPAPEPLAQAPEAAVADVGAVDEAVADQEAPRAAVKSEEPPAPGGKEPDDTCVVLISNLPEKGYSVEEIFNLAKPFGGLRDVLILSSHKKAYLEISRKSADSMVKFYTCFAISLDGSQLCISMVPQFQTIKDEEAIFTTLIKDSDPKVNTDTIHKQFVHLGNLPDDGYRELEVVCVGLRFGRVDHYVILKNKNKAILQLDSPCSARSMHSSLQHQPYTLGEHTLTCALSPRGHAAQAEAVKTEVEQEPRGGSSGFKTDPEASGAAQTAAAQPPAEPSVAKQGPASPSPSAEEALALQTEPSESRCDGATAAAPPGPAPVAMEKVNAGGEAPVLSVEPTAAEPSQMRSEAAPLPSSAEKEEAVKDRPEPALCEPAVVSASEEDVAEQEEALPAPAPGSAASSAAGRDEAVPSEGLAAGEPTGAVPAALPPEPDAPAVETAPAGVAQTNESDAPQKNTVSDAVKTEQEIAVIAITEQKPVLHTVAATEEQPDAAGADAELKAEEPTAGRDAEENPQELLVKTEAEMEKKLEKSVSKVGTAMEDAPNAVSEKDEGSSTKAHQSKGAGAAKTDETRKAVTLNSSLSIKDSSCVGKTILKAVVYLPDISKSRCPAWRNQPCLWKGGEQKTPSKPETRSQTALARRTASKEEAHPRPGRCRASRACAAAGKGGNGRNSSQQEKEPRAGSKPAQEGESRVCSGKKDAGSTKVSAAGNTKPGKGGSSSSANQKEEEKLFPFNLDEFVTVDEVVEETEPPVRPRRNPPRAKRKDAGRPQPSCEPAAKRRRAKGCVGRGAERQPSFLTLDETEEEEEEVTAQLMAVANLEALSELQGLVVVDEVMEEEEPLSEAVKDPQALVTLDELSEQDEPGSQKDVPGSAFEEPDLKAEPLVTVDEIGEVEELPLNEPTGLSAEDAVKHKEDEKGDPADASSQVPDDPSALVTVDEIQEDADDNPLVTLDEVNEDEDDFLADFNRLKEELNFVTVDEVGEEDKEEENPFPGKILSRGEEDEDVVAAAGPEETGGVGDTRPEVVPANTKPRAIPGPAEA